jgi:DNA invertase Pin-like site-specific DNA recombinase
MRVAGYVRELTAGGESLYAQSERVRRWTVAQGYQLIVMCQDARDPGGAPRGEGFRALLEVASSGHTDAVVVPSLEVLSTDILTQEVILHDLRSRNVQVISTREEDARVLTDPRMDPARLMARDVLARRDDYEEEGRARVRPEHASDDDIVIQLVAADGNAS